MNSACSVRRGRQREERLTVKYDFNIWVCSTNRIMVIQEGANKMHCTSISSEKNWFSSRTSWHLPPFCPADRLQSARGPQLWSNKNLISSSGFPRLMEQRTKKKNLEVCLKAETGLTWQQKASELPPESSSPSGCALPAGCPPRASSWWPWVRMWCPVLSPLPARWDNRYIKPS